ncbi:MAG TPA: hypothetical protein VE988_25390 [Gemmataceae bacterium]|nr:hypothetical protein [Gemmataceae bacterium]
MSTPQSPLDDLARQLRPKDISETSGFDAKELLEDTEKKIDQIEMLGEEEAAGFRPPAVSQISPGMRFLHSSRTIHQLVTDRNRAVGIFLAVAGLLWTASAAAMNAHDDPGYIIPLSTVKRWCMPFTFAVMTVLAVFVAFLLIRTRVGLIYEVAKMNVLLGLPIGRVKRIQPLSIFFIMQAMVSLGGGCSAGLLAAQLLWLNDVGHPAILATLIGAAVSIGLMVLYVLTVKHITSDDKLEKGN